MKDKMSDRNSQANQSAVAQPVASVTPSRVSIWCKGTDCSPRASIAISALDAVRSTFSLLAGLIRTFRSEGENFPKSDPERKHDVLQTSRTRKLGM